MSLWARIVASIKRLFGGTPKFEPQEKDGVWYQEVKPGVIRMGITNQAYEDLGDISFMDFSSPDDELEPGDDLLELEGAKAVETLKSPVKGKIIARNNDLLKETDQLASHATQANWLVDVKTA
ncbi:glycine cleavage system protein H [Secundilactobacillus folii]|uniref:Glycine cleavage system protein H n=1 Tax=Secundilactobacillus folii TaxID=2678357 RepID=A0A7X3C416_9LACO|nr:glycine cleavage system protein H [Secundilactobacillus folii]MTV83146.1 glycine cleavage system protein H [Secundilactobacillus folii]